MRAVSRVGTLAAVSLLVTACVVSFEDYPVGDNDDAGSLGATAGASGNGGAGGIGGVGADGGWGGVGGASGGSGGSGGVSGGSGGIGGASGGSGGASGGSGGATGGTGGGGGGTGGGSGGTGGMGGGGGIAGDACVPSSCQQQGACNKTVDNGCGDPLVCGNCAYQGQSCVNGLCAQMVVANNCVGCPTDYALVDEIPGTTLCCTATVKVCAKALTYYAGYHDGVCPSGTTIVDKYEKCGSLGTIVSCAKK